MLDRALASGTKSGYKFRVTTSGSDFAATAVPESYGSSGYRSFYISGDGVMRAADMNGLEANANANPYEAPQGRDRNRDSLSPIAYEGPSEASAIRSLRKLHSAEATYQDTAGAGRYGSVSELYQQRLIGDDLARGEKDGYQFKLWANGNRFELVAVPESGGDQARGFFISEEGVIRTPREPGGEPNALNPPADLNN